MIHSQNCCLHKNFNPIHWYDYFYKRIKKCRERVLKLGVSQISGGSKTSVGGYAHPEDSTEEETAQFDVEDRRSLDDIIKWLMELGYVPSFCTACYREGRVGDRFMEICKEQKIHNFCHPNAIMTLKEYLEDYASTETKKSEKN